MKTWARRTAVAVVLLVATAVVAFFYLDAPRPRGTPEGADALARQMMSSVDAEAWAQTGALRWTYAGRYSHLWDRQRHLVRVRQDGFEALVDLNEKNGIATQDGVPLEGEARAEAVQKAYAAWANDSFWLNAMNKAFDPDTTRAIVPQPNGDDALLVEYGSGGVTPGDAYLWHLDETGRPVQWEMWVSIIPIGGLAASWDDWEQLRTGAWVSTRHTLGPLDIAVTDLDGAETLAELEPGADPFGALHNDDGNDSDAP